MDESSDDKATGLESAPEIADDLGQDGDDELIPSEPEVVFDEGETEDTVESDSTTEFDPEGQTDEEAVPDEVIEQQDQLSPEMEVEAQPIEDEVSESLSTATSQEIPPEIIESVMEAEETVAVDEETTIEPAEAVAEEQEEQAEAAPTADPDDGRLWYVVHCYSGYENKVRHNLEQRIESMGMKGKIFDVVVPTEEEMEVKDGKRRTVERRVFPGYILVQMLMDEDSWYVVRNTPGVTGFVGMGNDPTPLRPEEVQQIIKRMEAEAPRIKVTYSIGQKVRIIDGPFNDFIGTVDDIDMNRAKVRVMVSFFGRETPVELDFLQVEKA
jgi:transcriptional antiterminator NusG